MKNMTATLALLVLLSACPALVSAADAPPALEHNPFSRPSSEVIYDDSRISGPDDLDIAPLELQATMIGSVNKLANVGGRILKRGDEIQGHVLIAIYERYAVFRRNGKNITVYVKPILAKDDE